MPSSTPGYIGYPVPKEVKDIKYEWAILTNPVIRGIPLLVGAYAITNIPGVAGLLWTNAKFGALRGLPDLKGYTERYDPTVIRSDTGKDAISAAEITSPKSFKALSKDTPGRYHSVSDYHSRYLSGELTPLAVVQSLLPMIRRDVAPRDEHSIAFIDSNVELIMKAAEASTERYKNKAPLGILDGVPIGIKDECHVAGYRTTNGRKLNEAMQPVKTETIWPILMWERAGAINMGKLNMHEIGMDTTNNNPNWGTPRNPHNNSYYTGGSSGGSAYTASAGLLPITLGFDGGGSIRIPASFCGIYGLKPSHFRVGDSENTVTAMGPIAGTMADLDVAFRVLAIPDPNHPVNSLWEQPQPLVSPRPKVLGICEAWLDRADAKVQKPCRELIDYMRDKLGYTIVPISLPLLSTGQLAHTYTILSEATAKVLSCHPPSTVSSHLHALTPANQILMSVSSATRATDLILSAQMRHLLMAHLAHLYRTHPGLLIVTPTSPMAGWPIVGGDADLRYGVSDGNRSIRNMEFVWLANFAGNPAISCPVGYVPPEEGVGKGDVPIGVMAMGEWGDESGLIEWGFEVEEWFNKMDGGGGRKRPANWEDVLGNARTYM